MAAQATDVLNAERFGTAPLERDDLTQLYDVLRRLRGGAGDFVEPPG